MKTFLLILSTVLLTACAKPFPFVAQYYDKMDLCQYYGKPEGYKLPSFCGESTTVISVHPIGGTSTTYRITKY